MSAVPKPVEEVSVDTRDSSLHSSEWPLGNIFTRMLVQTFCPLLRSEILLSDLIEVSKPVKTGILMEQKISGELAGKACVGLEPNFLKALASSLGMKGSSEAQIRLSESFKNGLASIFADQEFECQLDGKIEIRTTTEIQCSEADAVLCTVDTKFGQLKAIFDLKPQSNQLSDEWREATRPREPRKIRVFASQLESVFEDIKGMEALEKRWLEGAQVRSQIRSHIKRIKRTIQLIKSEPFETIFGPARKLVVDISKQQGKQAQVVSKGTWVHLDKGLLNYLYEPILHLIRNSVDHGIEEPEERERLGKPATGTIKCITSFSEKGLKFILSDDGRGFDFPKIRSRAVAKGILSQDEAEVKTSEALYPLVFQAGFSTRDRADAISGRGLGLDIVKKGLESIGGSIRILSSSHHGTAFEFVIPLDEDFTSFVPSNFSSLSHVHLDKEQEERTLLLEEISGYVVKLTRSIHVYADTRLVSAAYEAYRQIHSIKGAAGFLGWNRVAAFCHHFEELLKLVTEEKFPADGLTLQLIVDAAEKVRNVVEASKNHTPFSLVDIRRIEGKLLQAVWKATQTQGHTHFTFGKHHLAAVEGLIQAKDSRVTFIAKPEGDFQKAIKQPYGALVQFSGDRRGYAGILIPADTFVSKIQKLLGDHGKDNSLRSHLWSLSEFASLMGTMLAEKASKAGIALHPSAPLTYYGWGEPLRILGNPTYCYSCELQGSPLYLAGDLIVAHEAAEKMSLPANLPFHPPMIMEEATRQVEKHFSRWAIPIKFKEVSSQSELVGFDNGMTVIISCVSPEKEGAQAILFMSYESGLASYIYRVFAGDDEAKNVEAIDIYDTLNETSNIVGGMVMAELERRRIKLNLSLPTLFVGKAYVANFNRLFVTNTLEGTTPYGKIDLQVLVTNHAG